MIFRRVIKGKIHTKYLELLFTPRLRNMVLYDWGITDNLDNEAELAYILQVLSIRSPVLFYITFYFIIVTLNSFTFGTYCSKFKVYIGVPGVELYLNKFTRSSHPGL